MSGRRFPALFLFVMVMGAGGALYFAPGAHRAMAGTAPHGQQKSATTLSLPLFFEPNQGQTDPRVKFLARGSGYGIFLTADEAVLELQPSAISHQPSVLSGQHSASSVIRMRLDGANSWARVSGASLLPGKSNYFIGNDPSKWRSGIPQFACVEYRAVYPGIDLVYYGHQGQLEYDFRVAPASDPNQIALRFEGASARLDSGDLILTTGQSDIRFRSPRMYQQDGNAQKTIAGSFRQIADNKIGFTVGPYDRSRELVIDPVLSYSTYLGGSGAESSVHVAIGPDNNIYLAGATQSSDFPGTKVNGRYQENIAGAQNIFIAVINPTLPPAEQLVYATYLGGSGSDTAAGVAVSTHIDQTTTGYDVIVAGSTSSTNFPTSTFLAPFQAGPQTGDHGFVSRLNIGNLGGADLRYSTYLAGSGVDTVTGLAIDGKGDAFVTGTTTSTNPVSDGFPANVNAFQPCPWQPGVVTCSSNVVSRPAQFFASKINTAGSGTQSMLYSTYFGGGYPASATVIGGGIAVDASGNMYFTGGTNMPGVTGPNGEAHFPLYNAQQSCLDEASKTVCSLTSPSPSDAFLAKINPGIAGQTPVFSTYLGGSGDDIGYGVAVDSAGNAYVTGSTTSGDWVAPTAITPFQSANGGGVDAFIAKIGNPGTGSATFPPTYFTYLGGSGTDIGQAIVVDANQAAHVTGWTNSLNLPVTNPLAGGQTNSGSTDAFVGLISTTASSVATGDYLTYLGGGQADQGTGIAVDVNNATYVSGTTVSTTPSPFPTTANALQGSLNGSAPDAFVSELGSSSTVVVSVPKNSSGTFTSPSPNPVAAGTQVAFTFDITNTGPDTATNVIFLANLPPANEVTSQSAKVISGSGLCEGLLANNTITCTIPSLAVNTTGTTTGVGVVEVDVTPTIPVLNPQITVKGTVGASSVTQPAATITDFSISATPASVTTTAGQVPGPAFTVTLTPMGNYSGTISMTISTLPTGASGTFTSTTVTLSGQGSMTTTLNISTTARPVTTGSLWRGPSLYATWLPVGGLSLLGLGIGAGYKRRRWLAGALLGLVASIILLQAACGSSSPAATTSSGTPAGNYPITITGTNGSVSHTTNVLMTVN